MTDAVKIYHNPRCSKSRDTLSLLKSNGIEPEVVLYLEMVDNPKLIDRPIVVANGKARIGRPPEDVLGIV